MMEQEGRLRYKMDLINKVTWNKYLKEVRNESCRHLRDEHSKQQGN